MRGFSLRARPRRAPADGNEKTPRMRGFSVPLQPPWKGQVSQSPRVSSDALPPAAVVFTVTVFSVAKRSR